MFFLLCSSVLRSLVLQSAFVILADAHRSRAESDSQFALISGQGHIHSLLDPDDITCPNEGVGWGCGKLERPHIVARAVLPFIGNLHTRAPVKPGDTCSAECYTTNYKPERHLYKCMPNGRYNVEPSCYRPWDVVFKEDVLPLTGFILVCCVLPGFFVWRCCRPASRSDCEATPVVAGLAGGHGGGDFMNNYGLERPQAAGGYGGAYSTGFKAAAQGGHNAAQGVGGYAGPQNIGGYAAAQGVSRGATHNAGGYAAAQQVGAYAGPQGMGRWS